MNKQRRANLITYPPLLLITLMVLALLARQQHAMVLTAQHYIIGAVLILFNLFVMTHHWFEKAHPKYSLTKTRVFVLCLHLLGGSIELIASVLGILLQDSTFAMTAALSALLLHLPAAIYMLPEVSGAKGIMVPAYIFVVLLNGLFAVGVLINPERFVWLVCLFFSLNIYVLCRVFYVVFRKVGLFPYARYTAAILFSCFMLLPMILGTIGNIILVFFILTSIFAQQKLLHKTPQEINDLYLEHQRTEINTGIIPPILDKNQIHRIIYQQAIYSPKKAFTDLELAKIFFDSMDSDRNGYLEQSEWEQLAQDWPVTSVLKEEFFEQLARENKLDFMTFYHKIWLMGAHFTHSLPEGANLTLTEKVSFVFKQIDVYNQGFIGIFEWKLLLTQWGLCEAEVKRFTENLPEKMDFPQFYQDYPAIWNYYLR